MQSFAVQNRSHLPAVILFVLLGVITFCLAMLNARLKRSARMLAKAKDEWERTFDAIDDSIMIVDAEYRIVRANRATAALLGRDVAELPGLICYEEFHKQDGPVAICPHMRALRENSSGIAEIYEPRLGRWFHVSVGPFPDARDGSRASIHVARDITDRKNAELRTARSEEKYREFVEGTDNLVTQVDAEGNFIFVNHIGQKVFGMDPATCIGQSAFAFVHPEDRQRTRDWFFDGIRRQVSGNRIENRQVAADGTVSQILWVSNFHYDGEGKIVYVNGIGSDITQLKAAKEVLERSRNELEDRVRERTHELGIAREELLRQARLTTIGHLSASVAHDLRNPLGAIGNAAYFLKISLGAVADEKVGKHLGILEREVARANEIITDLFDVSKKVELKSSIGDINALISQVLDTAKPPAETAVKLALDPGLPRVSFDPKLMTRVLHNLVTNAVQAMPGGGTLTIATLLAGETVKISIADSGTGIAAEDRERIFEPLFTRKTRGVGLGLAVVKAFVEAHGGGIGVDSVPGRGAAFVVSLPIHPRKEA